MKFLVLIISLLALSCSRPAPDPQAGHSSTMASTDPARPNPDTLDHAAWFAGIIAPVKPIHDEADAAITAANDPVAGDSIVASYRTRMSTMLRAIGDSLNDNESFMNWLRKDTLGQAAIARMVRPLGCSLLTTEGLWYVDSDSRDLLARASQHCTPAMQRFLKIRATEEAEGFSDDAALVIPWDVVGDRVATWETFIPASPGFLLLPEAQYWHDVYLRTYLTGMDNSPIYTFDEATLDPKVRKSYERFTSRYPDLASTRVVGDYLELLEREGFVETEAVQEFLKEKGIDSMMGMQPPQRL